MDGKKMSLSLANRLVVAADSLAKEVRYSFYASRDDRFIYFAWADFVHRIKIGMSVDPYGRETTIQRGSPVPVKIVAGFQATRSHERAFHEAFKDVRLHGEWFLNHPDLVEFVSMFRLPEEVP